ncbi:MAG: hypothetical protein ACLU37_02020 [Collinsella sp.]
MAAASGLVRRPSSGRGLILPRAAPRVSAAAQGPALTDQAPPRMP